MSGGNVDVMWQVTGAASLLLSVPVGLALRRAVQRLDERRPRTPRRAGR